MNGKSICPICVGESAGDDDDIVMIACAHIYHNQCLEYWMKSSPLCPICSHQIKDSKKVYPQFERDMGELKKDLDELGECIDETGEDIAKIDKILNSIDGSVNFISDFHFNLLQEEMDKLRQALDDNRSKLAEIVLSHDDYDDEAMQSDC